VQGSVEEIRMAVGKVEVTVRRLGVIVNNSAPPLIRIFREGRGDSGKEPRRVQDERQLGGDMDESGEDGAEKPECGQADAHTIDE